MKKKEHDRLTICETQVRAAWIVLNEAEKTCPPRWRPLVANTVEYLQGIEFELNQYFERKAQKK